MAEIKHLLAAAGSVMKPTLKSSETKISFKAGNKDINRHTHASSASLAHQTTYSLVLNTNITTELQEPHFHLVFMTISHSVIPQPCKSRIIYLTEANLDRHQSSNLRVTYYQPNGCAGLLWGVIRTDRDQIQYKYSANQVQIQYNKYKPCTTGKKHKYWLNDIGMCFKVSSFIIIHLRQN